MDIYLTSTGGDSFTFPALPERIRKVTEMGYATYETINSGEFKFPKGRKDGLISWDGDFYGKPRRKMNFMRQWTAPKQCVSQLRKWMLSKTVLRLLVTETPINEDVTIARFNFEPNGGYGDIRYTIEFCPHRDMKIYTTEEAKITSYERKTTERNAATKPDTSCYTVREDECMWNASRWCCGSGGRWGDIYDANRKSCEEEARRHGQRDSCGGERVYAGQKLYIPESELGWWQYV